MAKVILEQKLKEKGQLDRFEIYSAGYTNYSYNVEGASANARETIRKLFGEDLLATHRAKIWTPDLVERSDLILVMKARMKSDFPSEKTWTLKEYAGESGDIADPVGHSIEVYLDCADEISTALDDIMPKLG